MRLPRQHPLRSPAAGFTLIEILLVVGIIAILMGAVIVNTGGFTDAAKITATKSKIVTVVGAIRAFETRDARNPLPNSLGELVGPPTYLLKEKDINDAWNHPLYYVIPARGADREPFEIYSAGPDGKPETTDDISSVKDL